MAEDGSKTEGTSELADLTLESGGVLAKRLHRFLGKAISELAYGLSQTVAYGQTLSPLLGTEGAKVKLIRAAFEQELQEYFSA